MSRLYFLVLKIPGVSVSPCFRFGGYLNVSTIATNYFKVLEKKYLSTKTASRLVNDSERGGGKDHQALT